MRVFILLSATLCITLASYAQKESKFSVEMNYGLTGSFFVRSYDEIGGPTNKTYLYKKNFPGTSGGAGIKYKTGLRSSLSLAYQRTANQGRKNYSGNINGGNLVIEDFRIAHKDDFYQLIYERMFQRDKPNFTYHLGIVYARMHQQEVMIENAFNSIRFSERNYKNSGLEEAGFVAGFHYTKKIDTRFRLGLKASVYYLATAQTLQALTLTPTLGYAF